MAEKRYRGNKYIHCDCKQDKDILVGTKFFGVMNPIGMVISAGLLTFIVFSNIDIAFKLGAVAILGLPWIIGIYADYTNTKRKMLKAGHSNECSSKVARLVVIYGSLWSDFKIIEEKDDGKRSWL